MTEAWLLFDETAIRHAAENPRSTVALDLPKVADLEDVPDPKQLLRDRLTRASERSGRRRKVFDVTRAVRHVVNYIDDFSPLRCLPAFQTLEEELQSTLKAGGFIG